MSAESARSGAPPPEEAGAAGDEHGSPLGLGRRGWLGRLLARWAARHDPLESERAVAAARAQAEDAAEVPALLALRRFEAARRDAPTDLLGPRARERLGELLVGLAPEERSVIGLLTTQWDVLLDIARLHGNRSGAAEAQLELLVVMALGLEQYRLARALHQAHLSALQGGRAPDVARWAQRVEAKLAPRGQRPAGWAAASIGLGLASLEARALAAIGSAYHAAAAIEEETVAELHALRAADKRRLLDLLVALAWADGQVAPEERRMIEQQLALARLGRAEARAVRRALVERPAGDLLAGLRDRPWDPHTRRFVLEQVVLLSLVDDEQAPAELTALAAVAEALGCGPGELDRALLEVHAFYARHREAIHGFGPVASALARLQQVVVARAQAAVSANVRAIVQEVRETGELARLLGAASIRPLTPEEVVKVKAQLLDVCKTIPALAIFLLPGGGLLLPILVRVLPFNLLPTAFGPLPEEAQLLPYDEAEPRHEAEEPRE